jgi:hypothetical protein
MTDFLVPSCAVLEALVMLFQMVGIAALCMARLFPGTRWAWRGKRVFVLALLGLAVAGASVGRHDSQFALFAGVTMTALLIGMIAGSGSIDRNTQDGYSRSGDAALAS